MKFGYLFFVLFCILMYDGWNGRINTKEKLIYSLICAFFCGMFTAEIIISYLRERAIRRLFGNCAKNIAKNVGSFCKRERAL